MCHEHIYLVKAAAINNQFNPVSDEFNLSSVANFKFLVSFHLVLQLFIFIIIFRNSFGQLSALLFFIKF